MLGTTYVSIKYFLKSTYHLDMLKKRIESMFTIIHVKKDGHCGFTIDVSCLKNHNAYNDNMTHMNLRIEISNLLVQGKENVSLLKHHLEHIVILILDK